MAAVVRGGGGGGWQAVQVGRADRRVKDGDEEVQQNKVGTGEKRPEQNGGPYLDIAAQRLNEVEARLGRDGDRVGIGWRWG